MRRSIEVDLTQPPAGSISWSNIIDVPSNVVVFSDVAFTGSYNDLVDTPAPGQGGGASTWGELGGDQSIVSLSGFTNDLGVPLPGTIAWNNVLNKPTFFSGSYLDLTDTPAPFSGSYNDLLDVPTFANVAVSGSYLDLTNTPNVFSGSYGDLTGVPSFASVAVSGSYNDLIDTPTTVASTWDNISGDQSLVNVSGFGGALSYSNLTDTPTLFSGSYLDLTNTPTLFSGSYLDLTNTPTLFSGAYGDLTDKPNLFSGSYADLTNTPTLFSGSYNDLNDTPSFATVAFSGSYNDLTDKPASLGSTVGGMTQATALAEAMALSAMNVALAFTPSDDGTDVTWSMTASQFDDNFVFNLPAGYEFHTDLIESMYVKFMCRDAAGNEFLSASNGITLSFDPTRLILTATTEFISDSVLNPNLGLSDLTARLSVVVRIQNFDFIIGTKTVTIDPSVSSDTYVNLGTGPDPVPPQPVLWEFYVFEKEQHSSLGAQILNISNTTFPITPEIFTFHVDLTPYNSSSDPVDLVTDETNTVRLDIPYNQTYTGTKLWSILEPSGASSASFTITWAREWNTPGLQINRNGTPVHRTSRAEGTVYPHNVTYTIPSDADGSEFTDALSLRREWIFHDSITPYATPDAIRFRTITCDTFPVTPENIKIDTDISSTSGDPLIALTDASYNTSVVLETNQYRRLFTIYDTYGSDFPTFTITKDSGFRLNIKRNGQSVPVSTDPADQTSSSVVSYTVTS
jgi:hypothetical protein